MIYRLITGFFLSAALFGCTADWDPSRTGVIEGTNSRAVSHAGAVATAMRTLRKPAFGLLPDQGVLVAYDSSRPTENRGAYTWHAVKLSEEHAFNAVREGGVLRVLRPGGGEVELVYDHHVEHSDGNWTWVGKDQDGHDAVLTFGERAAFGRIPNGGEEPLQLTMLNGTSWVMSTDRTRVPTSEGTSRGSPDSDYLVPPQLASLTSRAEMAASSGPLSANALSAAAQPTVDLVLGYTAGFASKYGGGSAAVTKLNNLVELTNVAYANSLIDARVRIVRAVQVNYPDNTANTLALEEMSGYRSGAGAITPNPAFNELRSARDQYGGDLVSLVRVFKTPENDGCGIAWLIGGGQSPISGSSAPFGYSVVSEGTDFDETDSKTYFCREETLAHEIGHNMGQTHSTEDAGQAGAHPYSYGYREASASGFYTIMAYKLKDSSQFSIPYFANPNVQYVGRPTGVASTSDNARSMNQIIPLIAAFRAAVVPVTRPRHNDINGDGRSDIIWHNQGQNRLAHWLMNGAGVSGSGVVGAPVGFSMLGTGDYDGDGRAELLWSSGNGGGMYTSAFTGAGFSGALIGSHDAGWTPIPAGDINGDGRDDILWRNQAQNRLAYWFMNATSIGSSAAFNVQAGLKLLGSGDFNGDGRHALVWTTGSGGAIYTSTFTGSGFTGALIGGHVSGWILVAAGDLDGDGRDDLIWHNPGENRIAYWLMNGTSIVGSAALNAPVGFTMIGVGDFNGDRRVELLWSSGNGGGIYTSTFLGAGFSGAFIGSHDLGWTPSVIAFRQ